MTNKQQDRLFWALQIAVITAIPLVDFLLNLMGV
jgi:hypothetical protein